MAHNRVSTRPTLEEALEESNAIEMPNTGLTAQAADNYDGAVEEVTEHFSVETMWPLYTVLERLPGAQSDQPDTYYEHHVRVLTAGMSRNTCEFAWLVGNYLNTWADSNHRGNKKASKNGGLLAFIKSCGLSQTTAWRWRKLAGGTDREACRTMTLTQAYAAVLEDPASRGQGTTGGVAGSGTRSFSDRLVALPNEVRSWIQRNKTVYAYEEFVSVCAALTNCVYDLANQIATRDDADTPTVEELLPTCKKLLKCIEALEADVEQHTQSGTETPA